MISRRLIDTNLIIRHLAQDHEKHARIAEKLFEASDRGQVRLVLLSAVLGECVFVLESFYKTPRAKIAAQLTTLLTSPGIEIIDRPAHVDALARYGKSKIHFVDCLLAASAVGEDIAVTTFDRDLNKFGDVKTDIGLEPTK